MLYGKDPTDITTYLDRPMSVSLRSNKEGRDYIRGSIPGLNPAPMTFGNRHVNNVKQTGAFESYYDSSQSGNMLTVGTVSV
jgi:hypothetical protein